MQFVNGMPANEITDATWQKGSLSIGDGNCVEVAKLPSGDIAVRNSRFPEGPALVFTPRELEAFTAGVKAAEFDHLIG
ncbi:DUF397 domain-containing protein [Streptomyces sp. CSDS2]|uniref:DUF397 domain-containing protein n=1 Tax=Streptomyces sp. CSDS2 TaxID=3055051 RepID=UPI0025B12185|nr:DUF397 domain-containing protein [Streptomyces sp. CSDS2]MDN3265735.1 DUF397 domain-containing protein [Streptomyces sp. CSDS2]